MDADLQLFPESASTISGEVDALYLFLTALTLFFVVLIAGLIIGLSLHYRQNSPVDRSPLRGVFWVEVSWLILPLPILMGIFYWGADLFFRIQRPPADAMEIAVIGKQWMWKFQHPNGHREIDALHVPVGQPVRLKMISQDVIHSFFVPAFRVKQDVLPGRYTSIWFEATRPGTYHLFCTEYCGTQHAYMRGSVVVLSPTDYQNWLRSDSAREPPALVGQRLFEQYRCDSCHHANPGARGPNLQNVFAHPVPLANGATVVADEEYIRESILYPRAKVVAGYEPIMPTFEGQLGEEEILYLTAYIQSLATEEGATP